MTILCATNLGKAYCSYPSEWMRFARWFGLAYGAREEHWVLRGASFEIRAGEAVGIIGQNGAGKSTLLKLIAGTLFATEGQVKIRGRISAILELGMGFNIELTGRQNAFHTLSLMGHSQKEIERVIQQIEDFAEIGEYFDQPMRTYSSGMQMRVAFSVASAFIPEILIVDEALSVGDVYFQHKSFNRIREFQNKGTTILLVSHDRNAIQSICDRAILLDSGNILKDGIPEEVFDYYTALMAKKEGNTIEVRPLENGKSQTTSGTGEAKVEEITLYNHKGEPAEFIMVGEAVSLVIRVRVHKSVPTLVLGYGIKDRLGQVMYGTNTWLTDQVIHNPSEGSSYQFNIRFDANLGVGSYSIQTALVDRDTHLTANYEWKDLALIFNVGNVGKHNFIGCNWIQPKIDVIKQ